MLPPKIQLDSDQRAAFGLMNRGDHVLITGPAGSGKSTLLNHMRATWGDRLVVTASTGIAALNVGGSTLHSWAGLGRGIGTAQEIAGEIRRAEGRAFRNIRNCEVLAIDEISMISGELLDTANEVFKIVRENGCPFGGVQLVAFGDFCQLPPVSKEPDRPASFAFESRAWAEAEFVTRLLTKVHRQADQQFVEALAHLRVGDLFHPSVDLIGKRNNAPLPSDGIRPIIIHTHNADVDAENAAELAKLPGREYKYHSVDTGRPQMVERLNKDCLAPQVLRLRVGAQVMLLSNVDVDAGLVNGRFGVVIGLKDSEIIVRFGKHQVVSVETHTWESMNGSEVVATRTQYPLRLAYAITTHKSQGQTLDRALCHLDPRKVFECGQAYVAVSRAKSLDGLFLRRSTRHAFRAHPKAVKFYQRAEAQTLAA